MTRRNTLCTAALALAALAVASPSLSEAGSRVTFAPATIHPMPISVPVHAVAAADLDADGDFDIAVALGGHPGSIVTLLNHGDGAFAAPVVWTAGSSCFDVAAGDLTGDGSIDLAVANNDPDFEKVTVLLNRGVDARRGWLGFAPPQDYSTGNGLQGARGIALGDLDGDGDLDAATTHLVLESVTVLTNNGHGTLSTQSILTLAADPISIVIGDVSGDGDSDVATAHQGFPGSVTVLLDTGQLSFAGPPTFTAGSNPNDIIAADIDGDEDLDLLTANIGSSVTVLLNNGQGGFVQGAWAQLSVEAQGIDVADFDGDGDVDAAVGGSGFAIGEGGLDILLNNGHGTLTLDQTLWVGGAPEKLVATAVNPQGQRVPLDLDGDGDADIVTANNPPYVVAVVLNTTTIFDPADLNEDGKVDGLDLAILLGFWGPVTTFPDADLNGDGIVNGMDLAVLLGAWG